MATAIPTNEISSKLGNFSTLNPRELEDSLSAFAKRFPDSGRIVHALAQEYGGVIGLADQLEKNNLWEDAETWMGTRKPKALSPEAVRGLFNDEILDGVAHHLGVSMESVEAQSAVGIPKLFSYLAADESLDLGSTYALAKRKKPNRQERLTPP